MVKLIGFSVLTMLQAVLGPTTIQVEGILTECLLNETENDSVEEVIASSNTEWSTILTIRLEQLDSCWIETYETSYVTWDAGEAISVSYRTVEHDENIPSQCKNEPTGEVLYYPKNQMMYTSDTPWPYNNDRVCSYNYTFVSDNTNQLSRTWNVTLYTNPNTNNSPDSALDLQSNFQILASLAAYITLASLY